MMNINQVKPYPKNAKKHPDKQLKQIAESIKEFGWQQPIVVDDEGVIIVGHGRWEAYEKFKDEYCLLAPEIKEAILTKEQANAYRLADNKLNESEWDMKLAVDELKELSEEMQTLTGFDLDLLIEPDEKDDEIPTDVPPVAKLGDLWALGRHRLLCGDATKIEDVERLMDGKKADMVFTDPPYNVDYSGRGENTSEGILNDKMSKESFDTFLGEIFKRYSENCKAGGGAGIYFIAQALSTNFKKR